MDLTALTLFGRARYQVLACLFALGEAQALHLREIARRSGLSPTATQYELRRLVLAGLVREERASGRPLYGINSKHAIAPELRELLRGLEAASKPRPIEDDAFWRAKRSAQARDYAARDPKRNSPFLADRRLASALRADLGKDVNYDY